MPEISSANICSFIFLRQFIGKARKKRHKGKKSRLKVFEGDLFHQWKKANIFSILTPSLWLRPFKIAIIFSTLMMSIYVKSPSGLFIFDVFLSFSIVAIWGIASKKRYRSIWSCRSVFVTFTKLTLMHCVWINMEKASQGGLKTQKTSQTGLKLLPTSSRERNWTFIN